MVTLRSNGQDSGSHQSGSGSNRSEVRAIDPHRLFTQQEGLLSSDEFEPKESSGVSNETPTQGLDDESQRSAEFEEVDVQLPASSASMSPTDDVADEEQHADLPMLHTEEQWEKLVRQGVRSRTSNGKKSVSPLRR